MEKNLKIISVLSSVKGKAHRAICYNIDRTVFSIKLNSYHREAKDVFKYLSEAKLILIEDIDLSVHLITKEDTIVSYKDMDMYYAFFDVLSVCMANEVRLTQESFHQECLLMQTYSCPSSVKLNYIEVRQGLTKTDSNDILKKEKALKKINKKELNNIIEKNFKGTIIGLFLHAFSSSIISFVFWYDNNIFGLMLSDYKIIPLKLNTNTFRKVCDVFGFDKKDTQIPMP